MKKTYIKPESIVIVLNLHDRVMYEGPNNYNGGGMAMLQDSKTHKPVSIANTDSAPENTEEDECGAKSFSAWDEGGLSGWGD
ncbi:MAG: hypothetical protein PUD58_08505 [Prevotella sp.]|uniref:hypothetical protein n=1 Tax=Prevotella sp. TaxID=59823 RepID=UPI002588F07E|nr:hypothetical protein [Prevotella sp.]MDD6854322.1 hypothetical protein [Prevotella sp.]